MAVGALVVLPMGIAAEGARLLSPPILGLGPGVALLSSVIPYSLELIALRRLPIKVFGVLMSLEPVMASGISLLVLGEHLTWQMLWAIALVCSASVGSTLQSEKVV